MDPTTFGPYRILRKLSGGGMGRVYLAEDTEHNRRMVALKLIDIMEDQEGREVLEAERRGAILQKHFAKQEPRATLIYEYGEREGYFFVAMEYVAGRDLSEVLEHGPMAPAEAVRISRELCEVLERAHRFRACVEGQEVLGIVHGDIKPRNVRITPEGGLKLLDFGIAKAISVTRKYTRNPFGSTAYSSPERLVTGDVDVASDVWAVGIMLFEMLTGKRYFQADQESRLEALIKRYNEVAPLPSRIPYELQTLLRKALAPDPVSRFGSATELGRALREASLDRQGDDSPTGPIDDAVVEATRRTPSARSSIPPPPPVPGPPPIPEDATRRTRPGASSPAYAPPPPFSPQHAVYRTGQASEMPPAQPRATPAPIRPAGAMPVLPKQGLGFWGTISRVVKLSLVSVVLITGCTQMNVWKEAGALQRDIESDHAKDMDAAWKQYQSLESRNHMPFALYSVKRALEDRMMRWPDQVLADYRDNDQVVVKVAQWQRAEDLYRRLLEMSPSDKKIKGKLRVCEGHIARINLTRTNQDEMLQQAKQDFEEAQELMPKSPDPLLGLARLYLANFHDVERGEECLRKADRNGHPLGRRDKSLLADAYSYHGDELAREAVRVHGLPQERGDLDKADEAYRRAEELWSEVSPYGDSSTMLRRVHASRERLSTARDQALRSGL